MDRLYVLTAIFVFGATSHLAAQDAVEIDFSRDIRPILSDTCYRCHGPDEEQLQADLRLDSRENVFADRDGYSILAAGDLKKSELWNRISSDDPDVKMPPEDAPRQLTAQQRDLIKRWIQQGANWQDHWSFEPIADVALPKTSSPAWTRTAIDNFILKQLDQAGLTPASIASKETLIRRVTLDLTGLPPTQAEVDAFLADQSPDAYERLVDRLLESPRYGERQALAWLDAARFADTSGYQTDGIRHQWRWREWVIDSFNTNKPFNEFTIEQLAGDLIPDATPDQLLATGFNRNHRANSEGGIVFEEYLVEYAVDRVDTTATVWLGLTMQCARCHDHKYDPISQREFYQMMAFFNNIPERGRVIKYGNSFPIMLAPTPKMKNVLDEFDAGIKAHVAEVTAGVDDLQDALTNWDGKADSDKPTVHRALAIQFPWDDSIETTRHDADAFRQSDYDVEFAGEADPELLKTKHSEEKPSFEPGVFGSALKLNAGEYVEGGALLELAGHQPMTMSTWVKVDQPQTSTILSISDPTGTKAGGFSMKLVDNHVQINWGPRWLDDCVILKCKTPIDAGKWNHIAFAGDGTQRADGFQIYINGKLQQVDVLLDIFTGTFKTSPTLRFGSELGKATFAGAIDETRLYYRVLRQEEVAMLAVPKSVDQIESQIDDFAKIAEKLKRVVHYLEYVDKSGVGDAFKKLETLQLERDAFVSTVPTAMVMQERPEMKKTYILDRGQYDKPTEEVQRGVPDALNTKGREQWKNRLDLAQWLVGDENPLTARVIVNRFWYQFFGRGLVRTQEDFGSQGDPPTHPELLEWLAGNFRDRGWNVKWLHKLIVTSAVYMQDSVVADDAIQKDPLNLLLARAPRLRLQAEMVRDQALAVSGLLVGNIGGPSVKPYQPEGLWKEIASQAYTRDTGSALYRRSMYTFWKRTVPPPTMTTFDASSRETCVLSRSRTNTPLQALALLNEVAFVEAARNFGQRMLTEGGHDHPSRLRWGFRELTSRWPTDEELVIISALLDRSYKRYEGDESAAENLVSVGDSETIDDIHIVGLAAYTQVASLLLNLDEVINRE